MNKPHFVKAYDSQSKAYRKAFKVFLEHTDQKVNLLEWLENFLSALPRRQQFIDAGAGTGQLTSWVAHYFESTVAIEPSTFLRREFRKNFPDCPLLSGFITEARPPAADMVLCSHVFYYITPARWMINLEALVSWLKPGGVALVILQNGQTDCNRMIDHFLGKHLDLMLLGDRFQKKCKKDFSVKLGTVKAHITLPDLDATYLVAEFMLNLRPMENPPSRKELEAYILKNFAAPQGGYRFSCHQDILQIHRALL